MRDVTPPNPARDAGTAQCPFCAEPYRPERQPCAHLVAAIDAAVPDGGIYLPFEPDSGLRLPEQYAGTRWTVEQLREAFGPVRSLLPAYQRGLTHPPVIAVLMEATAARLSFPLEIVAEGHRRHYYTAKGVIARRQVGHIIERLRAGFARLQSSAAAGG